MDSNALESILRNLYARCRGDGPSAPYMAEHASEAFVAAQVRTFQWYRRFLPPKGCLLDWGCRHAPDACLVKAAYGREYTIHGCDFCDPAPYAAFHEFAGLHYRPVADPIRLPYEDAQFDASVAAGVLEHAAMDYESLKELWRCLKPGGVLAITFLPNRCSIEEWSKRVRRRQHHVRRYGQRELSDLLTHTGFLPLEVGYQSRSAALARVTRGGLLRRTCVRTLQLHRLTSCLCAVARKVTGF